MKMIGIAALAALMLAGCVTTATPPGPVDRLETVRAYYLEVVTNAAGYSDLPDCDVAPDGPCSSDARVRALQADSAAVRAAIATAEALPTEATVGAASAAVDAMSLTLTGVAP